MRDVTLTIKPGRPNRKYPMYGIGTPFFWHWTLQYGEATHEGEESTLDMAARIAVRKHADLRSAESRQRSNAVTVKPRGTEHVAAES
jgi:hypothetical protein